VVGEELLLPTQKHEVGQQDVGIAHDDDLVDEGVPDLVNVTVLMASWALAARVPAPGGVLG